MNKMIILLFAILLNGCFDSNKLASSSSVSDAVQSVTSVVSSGTTTVTLPVASAPPVVVPPPPVVVQPPPTPVVVTPAPVVDPNWTKCANETQTCTFSGNRRVMYSPSTTDSRRAIKTFLNSTQCTNAIFTDVAPGVVKFCYYENVTTPVPVVVTPPPVVVVSQPVVIQPTPQPLPTVPPVVTTPTAPTTGGALWAIGTCGRIEKSYDNGVSFQEVKSITTAAGKTYSMSNYNSCADADHGAPSMYGLAYGNGRMIMTSWAIGSTLGSATSNQIRFYSDNKGVTWNEFPQTNLLGQSFWKLSYSTNGQYFLGSTHYGEKVLKSSDGINWSSAFTNCNTEPICKFRCSAAAGKYFIAGGDGGNYFSGPIGTAVATPATVPASRSGAGGSRRSTSSANFGVLGNHGSTSLAVVDGRTGNSGNFNIPNYVQGLFNDGANILTTSGNSIYRIDINCPSFLSCSGNAVKVGSMNMTVTQMWYLNGYLYGVNNGSVIYRSTTAFNANVNTATNITMVAVNTNASPYHASAHIKEMVYVP